MTFLSMVDSMADLRYSNSSVGEIFKLDSILLENESSVDFTAKVCIYIWLLVQTDPENTSKLTIFGNLFGLQFPINTKIC